MCHTYYPTLKSGFCFAWCLFDIGLQALAASHYVTEATVTVLLRERRVSPASETKPGKAPKNVDYVGALLQQP